MDFFEKQFIFLITLLMHMVINAGTYSGDKIVHFNAELTRACNLRCSYCFNDSGLRMREELGKEQWQRVVDLSKKYGAESALFTGGEPMMRKDAPNIIMYAIEQGLKTSILTNGLGLRNRENDEMVREVERMQISLDSANPYIHDRRRGAESWRTARDAIDYARALDTDVEISITLSEDRLEELEGVAEIAYATGSKVLIRPMQEIGRARSGKKISDAIDQRKKMLEERVGNIFVIDFAKYVPILGADHDNIVREQGYVTILPDGKIRGTSQKLLDLEKAA